MAYVPSHGDIVHLQFDPAAGREMTGPHYGLVVSHKEFNQLGLAMICPISQGQATEQRTHGTVVTLMGTGTATTGSIHCHQLKSLDWRVRQAKRKESVPAYLVDEVWARLEAIMRPDSRAAHAVFIPQAHHARPFRPRQRRRLRPGHPGRRWRHPGYRYPRPSLADHTPAGGTRHLTPEEARAALGEHADGPGARHAPQGRDRGRAHRHRLAGGTAVGRA